MKKQVLVVIVSTDDAKWLEPCFASLAGAPQVDFDTVLIANACQDDSADLAKAAGIETIVTDAKCGFAEANNIGIQIAITRSYQYIFLLNPDTKAHPDAIRALLEFLNENPDYGVAGSQQINYEDSGWSLRNNWTTETLEHARTDGNDVRELNGKSLVDHVYVQGAAMMMRSSLIERIGMLDPLYVTFYEETDLCRRCRLAGHGVAIVLNSKVKHFEGGNWRRSRRTRLRRDALYLRNQFLYFMSEEQHARSSTHIALGLIREQWRALRRGDQQATLPAWGYPLVLAWALRSLPYVAPLRRRNRRIAAGERLLMNERAIGPNVWRGSE